MTVLSDVDSAIATLVSDGIKVDYRVGDKSFKKSQKLKQLLELRKQLIEHPESDIAIMDFDFDINEFGENNTQYIG